MANKVMKSVKTKGVGFAPILKHFYDRCTIQEIIDQNVDLDPRRKVLTHGQACIAMITGILFQVMQLYKICQFADKTTILDVILPGIGPEEYFDDRMADTLDALYAHGIGDLELLITRMMILEFKIVSGETVLPDGNRYGFVSELTDLQEDILSMLEVPPECFSYDYLFDTG